MTEPNQAWVINGIGNWKSNPTLNTRDSKPLTLDFDFEIVVYILTSKLLYDQNFIFRRSWEKGCWF